jgi:hypothetical protein
MSRCAAGRGAPDDGGVILLGQGQGGDGGGAGHGAGNPHVGVQRGVVAAHDGDGGVGEQLLLRVWGVGGGWGWAGGRAAGAGSGLCSGRRSGSSDRERGWG